MFYLIIIIWIILDLYSKNLAYKYLQNQINILWDFLTLKYTQNTWIAFSTQIPWLKYLTIILIIWIFYYYFLEKRQNKNNSLLDFSFWLILAWAIWNGIERIFNWYVIDFIAVKYFSVFNLADSFITIWAIFYFYTIIKNKKF
jgi:signal peptidase II